MFDRYTDAFMNGHFQVPLQVERQDDGSYVARYERPDGQTISAVADDVAEANRRCIDNIREAVLDGTLQLGR
jgi:hypothetical protein